MGQAAQLVSIAGEGPRLVEFFCAQTYWRDRHKLARGKVQQFKTMERALEAGERLAWRHAGVVVFSVRGNPEVDYWTEPRIIATHGDVPLA